MKNYLLSFVFCLCFAPYLMGQNAKITENPTSHWPFYFEDFVKAKIFLQDESHSFTETSVNINLFTGNLQYLDNSKTIRILENTKDVKGVEIGDSLFFVFVDEFIQKIVAQSDKFMITKREKGNLSDLEDSSGAYGSGSASSALDKVNAKLIGGIISSSYPTLLETRTEGISFEPEVKYFFAKGDDHFVLNKRNLTQAFSGEAKKISSFIKKEKINLKNESDILRLFDFMNTL